ncbi:MAG: membrane protein insertion efficiency factor YidD [Thermomicrobiales bacterium]
MKWLALAVIRLYQHTVSRVLPPSCRFVPSCSEYGHEAIERYGVICGGALAVWRIVRCNPWGGHGYDPVPDLTQQAAGSRQQAASRFQTPVTDEQGRWATTQSSVLSPQSYIDTARTPHAPGHSLTEG